MTGRLSGATALITGGTSGIGEATLRLFLQEGANVVFAGRNVDKGQSLVTELGRKCVFQVADVRREADIESLIATCVERFGRLDTLFNNAGGGTLGEVETLTGEQFAYAMDLLLGSVLFGIKHAAPVMKGQGGGSIINNSSVAAFRTGAGGYLYSIAKAGVTHATRLAGAELARHQITVNSISPGGIATPIFFGGSSVATQLGAGGEALKMAKLNRNLARATLLGRAGAPLDVAYAALFLASEEGRYVTCHDLVVDAGMTSIPTDWRSHPDASQSRASASR